MYFCVSNVNKQNVNDKSNTFQILVQKLIKLKPIKFLTIQSFHFLYG